MATSTVPDDSDKHFTAFLFSKQKGGDVYVYIDVHFVVIQDLEKNREWIFKKYSGWYKDDVNAEVIFDDSGAPLQLDQQEVTVGKSYKIIPLFSKISLCEASYFRPDSTTCIPCCTFEIQLLPGEPSKRLCYKVNVSGVKSPKSFHIRYPLSDDSIIRGSEQSTLSFSTADSSQDTRTTQWEDPQLPPLDLPTPPEYIGRPEDVLPVNITATEANFYSSSASQLCYSQSISTPEYQTRKYEESSTLVQNVSESDIGRHRCSQLVVGTNRLKTDFYPMYRNPHGLAMIFQVKNFSHNRRRPDLVLKKRLGADEDMKRFAEAFEAVGYKPLKYTDFTADDILKKVKEIASSYSKDYDSLVICFTTHGENNYHVFGSDSVSVFVYKLSALIRECLVLKGKPILMFLQCCRTPAQDQAANPEPCPAGFQPDVFIAWATSDFCPAYRNPTYGSWFPEALRDVFKESAHHHDLHTMMHKVNCRVCQMRGINGEEQCVQLVDQLRYNVSF